MTEPEVPNLTPIPLPPRALNPEERALIDFLLADPFARDEVRMQVERAKVVSRCGYLEELEIWSGYGRVALPVLDTLCRSLSPIGSIPSFQTEFG